MRRRDWCWNGLLVIALLGNAGPSAWTQRRPPPRLSQPSPTPESPSPFPTPSRKMLQARFAELQKDVDRLLELATGLKEEVAKANEDVLPLSGVKKAEEIEKLAKKIQSRMKNL